MNIENIGHRFTEIVNTSEWEELQNKYNKCNDIYVLGHGGNMGIADHTAVDMTRLSNGTKNAICPGSCVVATSLINDTDFTQWMVAWLQQRTSTRTKGQMKRSLVYGISSSGTSKDVIKALQWASDNGMETCLLTAKPISNKIKGLTFVTPILIFNPANDHARSNQMRVLAESACLFTNHSTCLIYCNTCF